MADPASRATGEAMLRALRDQLAAALTMADAVLASLQPPPPPDPEPDARYEGMGQPDDPGP